MNNSSELHVKQRLRRKESHRSLLLKWWIYFPLEQKWRCGGQAAISIDRKICEHLKGLVRQNQVGGPHEGIETVYLQTWPHDHFYYDFLLNFKIIKNIPFMKQNSFFCNMSFSNFIIIVIIINTNELNKIETLKMIS